MSNSTDFYKEIFLHVILVHFIVSCLTVKCLPGQKFCRKTVFYGTKIPETVLKQPIRIEYLIKHKLRGALAEKQLLTEGTHRRGR